MKTQETYRTDIEFIDKDHTASMFMATCELNYIYDEDSYYIFVGHIVYEESYFNDCIEQANININKEIQRLLDEVEFWYEHNVTDRGGRYHYEKARKTEAIYDNRENIRQNLIKKYKKIKIVNEWDYIGLQKIFNEDFKYQSSWTYNDVLLYFRKHGFPRSRQTETEKLASSMNVCKARHILRNDIMTEEAILLPLLEMQERKDDIAYVKKRDKLINTITIIITTIITVITAPFTAGQSGWLLAAQLAAIAISIGGAIVGIVNLVLDSINEAELKDITSRTTDLMLKNMPKSGNFVDTSITDPYSMYANGRLWKQGAAGRDKYDQMKPHEPYAALDDKFKDSPMYDILNYKNDKKAGGDDYLPNLYRDGKWVNPSSLRTLLNGQIPIYLAMRTKAIEAIFKWLSKEDLGTYYIFEDNWDDEWLNRGDDYMDRYYRIEFENYDDVKGFTGIISTYWYRASATYKDYEDGKIKTKYTNYIVGYIYNVGTQWDKSNDSKIEKKTHNITDHSRIIFERKESKVLKGSEIDIFYIKENIPHISPEHANLLGLIELKQFDEKDAVSLGLKGMAFKHGQRVLDINKYYECEYEIWSYGGKTVRYYTSIKEQGSNSLALTQTNIKVKTYRCYKWFVRGEAKAKIRFRAIGMKLKHTKGLFNKEELNTPCVPYKQGDNYYRYFDRKVRFAYKKRFKYRVALIFKRSSLGLVATADTTHKDFVEVTIFHMNKKQPTSVDDERLDGTTYFNLSPFLNARRNITMF